MFISKLKSELSKNIPGSEVFVQGNNIRIEIPLDFIVKEFQNRFSSNMMIPLDARVENNRIILSFRVV